MANDIPILMYSEINIFCMLLVGIILHKAIRTLDKSRTSLFLKLTFGAIFITLGWDLAWGLVSMDYISAPIWVSYALNIAYFIGGASASFCWFLYSESIQGSRVLKSRLLLCLSAAPLLALIILSISAPINGIIFYLDSQGIYHRGTGYLLQVVLTYWCIIFTSLKALVLALKKNNYENRREYLVLASFVIMPVFFGGLQMFQQDIPLIGVGMTTATLMVYLNFQELKISIDPLTKMNNRNQLVRFLSTKMKKFDETKALIILMIDVDNFKKINDKFGHVQGDKALITVANVLKKTCSRYNCFGARYGGDEFILVYETSNREKVEAVCQHIHAGLAKENSRGNVGYSLSVSIGYAERQSDIVYIPDLIGRADTELYKAKAAGGGNSKGNIKKEQV